MTKKVIYIIVSYYISLCHSYAKNLNWQIFTKNLLIFKRWDGVKDEKF